MTQGYDLFENPLPPIVQYRTAVFQGKAYPNCVEAALFVVPMLAARRKTEVGYVIDPGVFPEKSPAREHFTRFSTVESHYSQEAHDSWGQILSQKTNVLYLKPSNSKIKIYELRPGFLNVLKCLSYVFEEMSAIRTFSFEDGKKGLSSAFEILGKFLSTPDRQITFDWVQWVEENPKKRDFFDEVIFLFNGKKSLVWKMAEGHSVITAAEDAQEDWRKKISLEEVKAHEEIERVAPFVSAENYLVVLKGLSAEDQTLFMYSLDLSSLKSKAELVRFLFETQAAPLLSYGSILFKEIAQTPNVEASEHVRKLAAYTIWPQLLEDDSKLDANTKKEILKRFPGLLSFPSTPLERGEVSGLMQCFKRQNYDWIEIGAPTSMCINVVAPPFGNNNLLGLEEMFLKYLPLFKHAVSICLNSLQLINNQYEISFFNAMQSLKRLKTIIFTDSNFKVIDYERIIDQLPKSLNHITVTISHYPEDCQNGKNKTAEEWRSILHSFSQHFPLATIMLHTQFTDLLWKDINEQTQSSQMNLTFNHGMILMRPFKGED